MRKNCSSDQEKLLKFKAEGREFSKFLISPEQFIQTLRAYLENKSTYSRYTNSNTL